MSIRQETSPSPVVLLSNVSVNLSPTTIAELAAGMGQDAAAEDLVLEPINIDNPVIIDDDDWFQPRPAASTSTRRLPSGGKNIQAMLKSRRSPSPTPSDTSASQSAAGDDSADEELSKLFAEERQRRAEEEARRMEWRRRIEGRRGAMEKKRAKARELLCSLIGEEKSLKKQEEALRTQLRALEDQRIAADKRRRSVLQKLKRYDSAVAKYDEMDI